MVPPSDRQKLSRRAFLRLAGLGTLLAACGSPQAIALPAPTFEPSATPTPTVTPTPTATSTHTPTATLTPTPTPTRGPLRAISLIHGPARSLVVDHALERFGVLPTQIRVDLGETVPDLRAYDAVIFAGGEYRPEEFDLPIFQAERERIMEALEANVPILAICLGHQLLAYWLGGEVKRGRWEIGWLPITVNEAGQADPIFSAFSQTFYGFLWHGDQVTRLPEEAILLASSELCRVQAYRLRGRPVWSLQFNPQYDPAIAESVTRHSPWIASRGWDQEEIIATGHREYDDVIGRTFGRFFELILKGEIAHAPPGISAPGVDLGDREPR